MQDLDRSRGWSTISWLNRLINGSRGGSRPICITLAPPSCLEPVQRHRINPLRLFLRGTIYLSYGERCSLSAWEWSLSLVALIIILGTICFISPSFPRDVIIVRLVLIIFQCSNRGIVYSSFYTSLLCIRYQFIKLYRKLNLCLKILFTRAWELFEKYIFVLRKHIYIYQYNRYRYLYICKFWKYFSNEFLKKKYSKRIFWTIFKIISKYLHTDKIYIALVVSRVCKFIHLIHILGNLGSGRFNYHFPGASSSI